MANPYFNAAYYLAQNPDVSAAGYTAATAESHYNAYGAVEGRAPAAWFNGAFYLAQNPDLQAAGYTLANVFAHFAQYGVHEGRSPSPNVALTTASLSAYAAANADLAKAFGITDPAYLTAQQKDALASHFYQYGYYESRPGNPVTEPVGGTFTLTAGADTFTGTAGNDVFNALTIDATGAAKGTFTGFDSIDGGAGNDTFNIYSDGVATINDAFPTNATVKNVETININNTGAGFGAVDASKFVGATAINQFGVGANVTKLAAATTAGFNNLTAATASDLTVTAADTATAVSVALGAVKGDGAGGTVNQAELNVAGKALNSVNVTGTIAQTVTTAGTAAATLNLAVIAGDNVETVNIASAVKTTLTVADGAGTKKVSTVDASKSAGGVTYVGAATVANISTGAGADFVDLKTVYSATVKAATLNAGAGVDTINILVDNTANIAGTSVTVDAGDGNDIIKLDTTPGTAPVKVSLNAGAGDDKVTLTDGFASVATTDVIDGGEGFDTVIGAGQVTARVADDYITLTKVIKNFEGLNLTTAEGAIAGVNTAGASTNAEIALDASKLANYKTFTFDALGVIGKVAADQLIVAKDNVTASAAGYISKDTDAAVNVANTVYAGSLNISAVTDAKVITAKAESVNLSVTAKSTEAIGAQANVGSTLTGDVKSATVTLTNGQDKTVAGVVSHDNIASISLTANTTTSVLDGQSGAFNSLGALSSLTLKGNGAATVTNTAGTLATVDASGLGGTYTVAADGNTVGAATKGLTYTSTNVNAETVKLGSGVDNIVLNASTYGKVDTIEGFNLVLNTTKTAYDIAKSDQLDVGGVTGLAAINKFTTAQTDLDLALKDAAAYKVAGADVDKLVFQMSGDTYVYNDVNGDNFVDVGDTVVKLVGLVDLDGLIAVL